MIEKNEQAERFINSSETEQMLVGNKENEENQDVGTSNKLNLNEVIDSTLNLPQSTMNYQTCTINHYTISSNTKETPLSDLEVREMKEKIENFRSKRLENENHDAKDEFSDFVVNRVMLENFKKRKLFLIIERELNCNPNALSNIFNSPSSFLNSSLNNANLILEIKDTIKKGPSDFYNDSYNEMFDTYNPKNLNHNKIHTPVKEPNKIGSKSTEKRTSLEKASHKVKDFKKEFLNLLNFEDRKKPSKAKITKENKSLISILNSTKQKPEKNKTIQNIQSSANTFNGAFSQNSHSFFKNESVKDQIKTFTRKFESDDISSKTTRNPSTPLKNYNTTYFANQPGKGKNLIKYTSNNFKNVFNQSIISPESNKSKTPSINAATGLNITQAETKEINLYETDPILELTLSLSSKLRHLSEREVKQMPER